jgi:hypothetical protein
MNASRSFALLALAVGALLLIPAPAAADEAQAQALLKQGQELLEKSDYQGALDVLKKARALSVDASIQLEIAAAHEGLGNQVEAAEIYESLGDEGLFGEKEKRREAQLGALRKVLARLSIECRVDDAIIRVNGRKIGSTPLPNDVYAKPGKVTIGAKTAGKKVEVEYQVKVGEHKTINITMREVMKQKVPAVTAGIPPSATPPAGQAQPGPATGQPRPAGQVKRSGGPSDSGGFRILGRRWTWVAAAGTVVFAAVGMGLGLAAVSEYGEYKDDSTPASRFPELEESIDGKATAANVMFGIAGGMAVVTGVLFLVEGLQNRSRAERSDRRWAVGAGPGQASFELKF